MSERLAPPEAEYARDRFQTVFKVEKPIIAMLHVWRGLEEHQLDAVKRDLEVLNPLVDGVLIENYGWGYMTQNEATSDTIERIRSITKEVVTNTDLSVGINILPNDYMQALKCAKETGAQFIQMDHIVGEFTPARSVNAEELRRLREHFPDVVILGGIHPKYYELVKPEPEITDSAREAAQRGDGVVVTGAATGSETDVEELAAVREVLDRTPLVIGSGLTEHNVSEQFQIADGAIVGSAFKLSGVRPGEPINQELVKRLVFAARS